jgi:hypothetical protein
MACISAVPAIAHLRPYFFALHFFAIIEHLQSNLPSAPNKFSRVILANALGAGPLYGQRWFACAARGCW